MPVQLCLVLASWGFSDFSYSFVLKVLVTYSSETMVNIRQTTKRYIQEDLNHYNHWCENLKACTVFFPL
jgi:hypothetical protein